MTTDIGWNREPEARAKPRQNDPRQVFEDAVAEMYRTQERLTAVRARLQEKPAKVTSKDGMITVTLDGRGEVTSIAFGTAKFRRMAPAELGAALVAVIRQARAESRARAIDAYQPFLPAGMDLGKIMAGEFSMTGMLDAAKRRGEHIMAEAQRATPAAQPPARKG